jgi:uncharacterized protein (DUF736 family)
MQVGAAWIKTAKSTGEMYMSLNIEYPGVQLQLAMFKNKKKEKDNQPDFQIIWNPVKKSHDQFNESANDGFLDAFVKASASDNDSDIPF